MKVEVGWCAIGLRIGMKWGLVGLMKLIASMVFLIFSVTGLSSAWSGEDYQARGWAATCTGCHGTEGRSVGGIPSLAGMDEQWFVDKMLYYRSEHAKATIMHQHSRGYTIEQINRMARYFQRQVRK